MARMLNGVSAPDPFIYIATGTGATAESTSDTALENENAQYGAQRVQANCSFTSPGTSVWSYLFAFTGSVIIRELGILNAASGGTLLLRHVLSENKPYSDGESVEIAITNTMMRNS
ncbi:hypothetical protein SAMN02910340_02103 [Methanosarcina thermophila]|jgi:hypothetical protein|uniref:Uncharacterized protein n=1 Tax=Methanosarcina thermophila TaxID=2210 RepID=A0A1I7AEZ3_METTE|nr:hypothetical protein [Methanosarcina thermophila]ALK06159.1 MAG: hypothetical protein AAY43_11280 [Methanosarcina sp. 795]SFT73501.1 hypothetical protein SAMN02910340_02103 [Methanosarcina thermophila]BAW29913.1 conserved hypothetical protein [Methanosarcina thermophila]GLI14184.1 hypothetical protein MTHERMMSTA1_13100 [Methanosarcina thermophila MST-A1]HOA69146.1 hypothetical protein [Methanosarcina thermophila]